MNFFVYFSLINALIVTWVICYAINLCLSCILVVNLHNLSGILFMSPCSKSELTDFFPPFSRGMARYQVQLI